MARKSSHSSCAAFVVDGATSCLRFDRFGCILSYRSMAAPHVAGAAAKIWAARPKCTNAQIQEALFNAAISLGTNSGFQQRNDEYGYGLVQTLDAYNYIQDNFDPPCGGIGGPSFQNVDGDDNDGSTRTCKATGTACEVDGDCCSNSCRRLSVSTSTCRPVVKAVKTKLGGSGGGSAGGNRQLRTTRGFRER